MLTGRKVGKKVPYIRGEGGTGKTLIFRELVGKVHGSKLMIVTPNELKETFGLEALMEAKAIVLEEFQKESLGKGERAKALMILEGGEMPVNRKFKSQRKVKVDIPIVVISNVPLGILTEHLEKHNRGPLLRRVREVKISPKDLDIEEIYEKILESKNEILLYLTGEVVGIKDWDGRVMGREDIFKINNPRYIEGGEGECEK